MTARAVSVTLILTLALAGLITIELLRELGNDALLLLVVLGGTVIWLLPGVFALALPAGAFGVVLLTHADPSTANTDEDPKRETVRLAVYALMLSTLTVGWLVPLASRVATGTFAPYQGSAQAEQSELRPRTLLLDELIARAGSMPHGQEELLRRVAWIAPSFLMPLFAGILVIVRPWWTNKAAVTATVAVFLISVLAF